MNSLLENKVLLAAIAIIVIAIIIFIFVKPSDDTPPAKPAKTEKPAPAQTAQKQQETRTIPVFNIKTAKISDAQKAVITEIGEILVDGNEKLSRQVLQEKQAAGADQLLSFARIQQDKDMSGTSAILEGMRSAIRSYYNNTVKLFLAVQKKLEASDIAEDTKTWILLGMKNGLDAINLTSSGDLLVLDQSENIIKMLGEKAGEWTAENGKVTFTNEEDQKTFDSYIAQIQKIKVDQAQLIAPKVQNYKVIIKSLGV